MSLAPCRIYVDELQNQALAEAYCDRIYAKAMAARQGSSGSAEAAGLSGLGPNAKQPDSIYLQLIQVRTDMCTSVRASAGCRPGAMCAGWPAARGLRCAWTSPRRPKDQTPRRATPGQGNSHGCVPESPVWRVQVFLSPSLAVRGKGPEALAARHADMARILSRRHSRIDVVHALTLIPDEVRWQCTPQRVVSS